MQRVPEPPIHELDEIELRRSQHASPPPCVAEHGHKGRHRIGVPSATSAHRLGHIRVAQRRIRRSNGALGKIERGIAA